MLSVTCLSLAAYVDPSPASAQEGAENQAVESSQSSKPSKKQAKQAKKAKKQRSGKDGKLHANKDAKKKKKDKKGKKGKGKKARDFDTRAEKELWMERAKDGYAVSGKASLYGAYHHGGVTASGAAYDMYTFTAAHRTLPMGTVVKVTDQENGRSVMVCITDRGPYIRGRIIDLSYAAATQLRLNKRGVSEVAVSVVSDEKGNMLRENEAYYVRYSPKEEDRVGPFKDFADAAALHEALRSAHPDAEVIVDADDSNPAQ
jgi:rare lipoprotein A (peptidoglycan hydrolase)